MGAGSGPEAPHDGWKWMDLLRKYLCSDLLSGCLCTGELVTWFATLGLNNFSSNFPYNYRVLLQHLLGYLDRLCSALVSYQRNEPTHKNTQDISEMLVWIPQTYLGIYF